jgi:uncharacterized membrane protein
VEEEARSRPRAPGILIGIGLGGFVDGIVLNQILQWHHLLSSEADYPKRRSGAWRTTRSRMDSSMPPRG